MKDSSFGLAEIDNSKVQAAIDATYIEINAKYPRLDMRDSENVRVELENMQDQLTYQRQQLASVVSEVRELKEKAATLEKTRQSFVEQVRDRPFAQTQAERISVELIRVLHHLAVAQEAEARKHAIVGSLEKLITNFLAAKPDGSCSNEELLKIAAADAKALRNVGIRW